MKVRRLILRGLSAVLLCFLLLLALAFAGGGPVVFVMAWEIVTGWIEVAKRPLPSVTMDWVAAGSLTVCAIATVWGAHWFLGWIHRHRATTVSGNSSTGSNPWRWRWTAGVMGIAGLVCLMAMSLVGIVHQAAWMAVSDEPTWVYRTGGEWAGDIAERLMIEGLLAGTNATPQGHTLDTFRKQWAKDYRVFKLVDDQEQIQGLIVWRRPESYGPHIVVVTEQRRQKLFKARELPKVIAQYGSRMRPVW